MLQRALLTPGVGGSPRCCSGLSNDLTSHEACSQPSRASEVTYKWSVMSLLRVFPVGLADPVHLSSTSRDVTPHPVHVLGTRVVRGTAIVGSHISTRLTFRSSPD